VFFLIVFFLAPVYTDVALRSFLSASSLSAPSSRRPTCPVLFRRDFVSDVLAAARPIVSYIRLAEEKELHPICYFEICGTKANKGEWKILQSEIKSFAISCVHN